MRGFDAMVDQCRHRIYSFAYYTLGSREEAEDVTQEVLIRLWENWDSLDKSRIMAWLIRVTRNRCLDLHRTRRKRHDLLEQNVIDQSPGAAAGPSDPETDMRRADIRLLVENALHTIEEPYRSIVILREIEDYTYAQICAALEMPLNTVKVYLHRGRRMLREQLQPQASGGSGAIANGIA